MIQECEASAAGPAAGCVPTDDDLTTGAAIDPAWSRSLYLDLRRLASSLAPGWGESVRPTVLVHEAWVRMASAGAAAIADRGDEGRRRFFALARLAMRSYLADRARRRRPRRMLVAAQGGAALDGCAASPRGAPAQAADLLAALARLSVMDPRKARVVELRFLVGLSVAQTARALDISERTVELDWRGARAWLNRELKAGDCAAAT